MTTVGVGLNLRGLLVDRWTFRHQCASKVMYELYVTVIVTLASWVSSFFTDYVRKSFVNTLVMLRITVFGEHLPWDPILFIKLEDGVIPVRVLSKTSEAVVRFIETDKSQHRDKHCNVSDYINPRESTIRLVQFLHDGNDACTDPNRIVFVVKSKMFWEITTMKKWSIFTHTVVKSHGWAQNNKYLTGNCSEVDQKHALEVILEFKSSILVHLDD